MYTLKKKNDSNFDNNFFVAAWYGFKKYKYFSLRVLSFWNRSLVTKFKQKSVSLVFFCISFCFSKVLGYLQTKKAVATTFHVCSYIFKKRKNKNILTVVGKLKKNIFLFWFVSIATASKITFYLLHLCSYICKKKKTKTLFLFVQQLRKSFFFLASRLIWKI